jgi:hypothetical protein
MNAAEIDSADEILSRPGEQVACVAEAAVRDPVSRR